MTFCEKNVASAFPISRGDSHMLDTHRLPSINSSFLSRFMMTITRNRNLNLWEEKTHLPALFSLPVLREWYHFLLLFPSIFRKKHFSMWKSIFQISDFSKISDFPCIITVIHCYIATFFLVSQIMFFFGGRPNYINIVGHVVGYAKKSILGVYWVCKWRKGVRKHLQTCFQASDTIRHGHSHYFFQWICPQKKHMIRGFWAH